MIEVYSKALDETIEVDRVIGKYTSGKIGPGLVVTAGVHGNEPSGIFALKRVFKQLEEEQIAIRGELTGLIGNTAAFQKQQRYIDCDLNRIAKFRSIRELAESEVYKTSEGQELKALMKEVQLAHHENITQMYFIDCHTTSSESQPYISVHRFPHSYYFAHNFPVYAIRGFDKYVKGTIDDWLNSRGFIGFTFEAGQHDDLAAIENHEAIIWLALAYTGMVAQEDLGCFPQCQAILKKTIIEGKKSFDLIHRYEIKDEENFRMEPGYVNFQPIRKEEVLAQNENGLIKSDWDARILMPLYQKQGDDGFFVVKEILDEPILENPLD